MMDCVVIGTEHHNTLGVIRSLGESNIHPIVYLKKSDKSFVEKSIYIQSYLFFLSYDELLSILLKEGDGLRERRIVISCCDKASELLDSNKNILSSKYVLPGMSGNYCVGNVQDKLLMSQIAESVGLLSPTTYRLPQELDDVKFPCISKPTNSNYGGKSNIRIFYSKEELLSFLNESNVEVFVQEYVDKVEEVQLIGCSLDGQNVVIPGMSKIIRSQHNTNTGYLSYSAIEEDYEETLKKSIEFIRLLNYRGLFSVEFIRGNNGKIYFLEANFRNDGNSFVVTKAGINLPVIWYKHCTGVDVSRFVKKVKSVCFMPEFQDHNFVKTGKVSSIRWIYEFLTAKAHSVWSLKDPAPFWECIREIRKR